jgi:hypothetical protein
MRRFSFVISITGLLLVLGAGCVSSFPITPIATSTDSGVPSPEGVITFRQGFGLLPGKNPMPADRPSSPVRVDWKDLPEIPPNVTVIRKRSTLPNATVLQNVTSAMNIPIGTLQLNPKTEAFAVQWKDVSGIRWRYDAATDRLVFEQASATVALTSAVPGSDVELTRAGETFMNDRGLFSETWSAPYLVYSWEQWWAERKKEGKCMTKNSIAVIRKMAEQSSLHFDLLSSLSTDGGKECVAPEFPNVQVIRFSASQDGEQIYGDDGTSFISGEVMLRADTNEVVRGWAELKRDADRSNYEAIQPDRLETYLRQGGVSGFPPNAISYSVTRFHKGEYRYVALVNGEERTFYIPAVQAEGTITYQNGSPAPYAIVVPLTREDQFNGF